LGSKDTNTNGFTKADDLRLNGIINIHPVQNN